AGASRLPPCTGRHCAGCARRDAPSHRPPAPRATATLSRPARAAGASSGAQGLWARPPFFHPLQALGHGVEALVELEPGSRQRWATIVGEGTPDGAAVVPDDLGLVTGASLHGTFQGAHTTDVFFENLLRMAVSLIDWLGRFVQVMKVTQLVRHLG